MHAEPGAGQDEARSLRTSDGEGHGVAEALGRLCDMAALRRPDDPLLVRFLPLYYSELPAGDVDDRKLDDIYAVAVAHLALARVRAPGQSVVRVLSPDRERDGWESRRTRSCSSSPTTCRSSSTPCAWCSSATGSASTCWSTRCCRVRRDDAHRLVDVASDSSGRRVGRRHRGVDADRDRPHRRRRRRGRWRTTSPPPSTTCRRAVDDFPAMRDRMEALGGVDPLLPWLAEGQFVFLGAADYDVAPDGALTLRERQRARAGPRPEPRFASPRPMAGAGPSSIARTDDVVRGLPGRAADGRRRDARRATRVAAPLRRAAGHERLPGQRARHPRRRRRRRRRARPRRGAHALPHRPGDAHRPREPAPRARPGARPDGRRPARGGHRRAPGTPGRAGVRGARAGRAVGHRARLPAPRAASRPSCPERIADAVAARLRRRPAHVRDRTSAPARWPGSRSACAAPTPRGRSTSTRSSAPSTSCRRRGPTGCGPCSSPTSARSEGRRLFDRVGAARPGGVPGRGAAGAGRARRPPHRRPARRRATR